MSAQEQTRNIIKKYKLLNKDKRGFELLNNERANLIYSSFLNFNTQAKVSEKIYPSKKKRPHKTKLRPIIGAYTNAFVEIGWLYHIKDHQSLVTRQGSTFPQDTPGYTTSLNPLYEFLSSKGFYNEDRRGKAFLESFFSKDLIIKLATENNQNFVFGSVHILREYLMFKKFLKIMQEAFYEISYKDLYSFYEGLKSDGINLSDAYSKDLYYLFLTIAINENKFWTNNEQKIYKEEYNKWWIELEKSLFQGFTAQGNIEKIFRMVMKKKVKK